MLRPRQPGLVIVQGNAAADGHLSARLSDSLGLFQSTGAACFASAVSFCLLLLFFFPLLFFDARVFVSSAWIGVASALNGVCSDLLWIFRSYDWIPWRDWWDSHRKFQFRTMRALVVYTSYNLGILRFSSPAVVPFSGRKFILVCAFDEENFSWLFPLDDEISRGKWTFRTAPLQCDCAMWTSVLCQWSRECWPHRLFYPYCPSRLCFVPVSPTPPLLVVWIMCGLRTCVQSK